MYVPSKYYCTENPSVKVRTFAACDWLPDIGLRDFGFVGGGEPSIVYSSKRDGRLGLRGEEPVFVL
jgi:hypothetical protein